MLAGSNVVSDDTDFVVDLTVLMLKTLPVKSLLFIFSILSSTRYSLVPALKYHCFFAVPEGEEHLSLGTGIRR